MRHLGKSLGSKEQAAKAMKPSDGSLNDAARSTEALAALDLGSSDAAANVVHSKIKAVALRVVRLVRV